MKKLEWFYHFSAFEKLRKVTFNFVMSVCLSIRPPARMRQLGFHLRDLYKIRYLSNF